MEHKCYQCDCPNGFCELEKCVCSEGFTESTESGYCEPIQLTTTESLTSEETRTESQGSFDWDSTSSEPSQISTDATEGIDSSTTAEATICDLIPNTQPSDDTTMETGTEENIELVETVTSRTTIDESSMEMKESPRMSLNSWIFIFLAIISCLLVSILMAMFITRRYRGKINETREDSVLYTHQCAEMLLAVGD